MGWGREEGIPPKPGTNNAAQTHTHTHSSTQPTKPSAMAAPQPQPTSPPWFVTLTAVGKGAVPLPTAAVAGMSRFRLSLLGCLPALKGPPEHLAVYVSAAASGDGPQAAATAELAKLQPQPHGKNARLAAALLAAGATANVAFCADRDSPDAFAAFVSLYCSTQHAAEQLADSCKEATSDAVRAVALCALLRHQEAGRSGGDADGPCGVGLGGIVVDVAVSQPQRAAGRPRASLQAQDLDELPLGITVFQVPPVDFAAGAKLAHQIVSCVRALQRGTWNAAQGRSVLIHVDKRFRDLETLLGIAEGLELSARGRRFLTRARATLNAKLDASELHFGLEKNCLVPVDAAWHRGDSSFVLAVWGDAGAEARARDLVRRALQGTLDGSRKVTSALRCVVEPEPQADAAPEAAAAAGAGTSAAAPVDPAFLALRRHVSKLAKAVKEAKRLQTKPEDAQTHQEKEKVARLPALELQLSESSAELTALGVFLGSQPGAV